MDDTTIPQPEATPDVPDTETPAPDASGGGFNIQNWLGDAFGGGSSGKKGSTAKKIIPTIVIIIVGGSVAFMLWGLAIWFITLARGEPGDPTRSSDCAEAFDRSKLSLYTATSGQPDPGPDWAISDAGKQYAINTLGIPESEMKQIPKANVENMIRAEVVSQFNSLSNTHGTTVAQAQQAVLSYQEHESSAFQLFDKNGRPSYSSGVTLNIMSLTKDKFTSGGKNKRIAASYDIKYAIYLGVQEVMGAFTSKAKGEGIDRWKSAIGYVFLPADPDCYWNGGRDVCRHTVAQQVWKAYENETPYACTMSGGTGDKRGPFVQKIQNGWLEKTYRFRDDMRVSGIVLHYTAGSNVEGAVSAMSQRETYTHAIIDKNGTVYQLLPFNKQVRSGSGDGNSFAVGIEIVGMNENELLSNPKQFSAVVEACKWLISNYSIPNVRGNPENLSAKRGIFGHYQTQGPWGSSQRGCNSPNKSDPGKTYMKKIWDTLGSSGTGC